MIIGARPHSDKAGLVAPPTLEARMHPSFHHTALRRLRSYLIFGTVFALVYGRASAAEDPPLEVIRSITYSEPAGQKLTADVYLPRGEGPFPGVLLVHGGAWVVGSKRRMQRVGDTLAERGYVAVSIDYRLAPKHKFPAQLDDCRTALGWMRDNAAAYRLDPRRMGGFGYSAGAHLVTLLSLSAAAAAHAEGTPAEDRILAERCLLQAVVAGGTPCDFQEVPLDSKRLAFWLGGTRRDLAELYRQASPLAFVTPYAPPLLLYHGEKDLLVPLVSARALKQSLEKAGAACELLVVAKAGHITSFNDAQALAAAADFFDRHLRPVPSKGHSEDGLPVRSPQDGRPGRPPSVTPRPEAAGRVAPPSPSDGSS